jgi:hypothetical protein
MALPLTQAIAAAYGIPRSYDPPSCRQHATAAEMLEYERLTAADEACSASVDESVACWDWLVTADHLARRARARACGDAAEARRLARQLMIDWQDGRCAVCLTGRAEVEDHDHATALVRGYLCRSCNTLEGFAAADDNRFDRYRQQNPASMLRLEIPFYRPIFGWADPEPPRSAADQAELDERATALLATRYGQRADS